MREHTLGGRFVLSFFWRRSPECGGERGDHPQNGGGETEGGAHYLGEPEGGAHHPQPAVWNDPWRHTCKHTVSKNIIKHGKNVDQCGPTPLMPLLAWARLGYATTSVGLPRLCRCRGQAALVTGPLDSVSTPGPSHKLSFGLLRYKSLRGLE